MKPKKVYKCKVCEYESSQWYGKCPNCNSWDSFEEIVIKSTANPNAPRKAWINSNSKIQTVDQILQSAGNAVQTRYPFSAEILSDFWNEGLVAGSLTLLAGEPGLGKSTLALQLLRSLFLAKTDLKLLYITAEESVVEVARRSQRLSIPKEIYLVQNNSLEEIEEQIQQFKPQVVVLDSIQTIFSTEIVGSPGSVSQVSLVANRLLSLSKSQNISMILIGHVTKEGQIAGPKTLEHLVDSVLTIEASETSGYRTLAFGKHRYGTTDNELLLKMEETGLQIVTDPSLALLENLETGVGVCYGLGLEKNLPLVVEIQALVSQNYGQGGFGRREALGLKSSKLNTLIAIIEKYLNIDLKSNDVYVQITGLPKNLYDESLDLPIFLAILSSINNQTLNKLLKFKNAKSVFAGRLTLSGKIRPATKEESRINTAKKLKFAYNPGVEIGEVRGIITGNG
jgi:DNA repair protein RadA/Sms